VAEGALEQAKKNLDFAKSGHEDVEPGDRERCEKAVSDAEGTLAASRARGE
jgi:hypothetical protein